MSADARILWLESLEVATIGLPFCVFKAAAGLWLLSGGSAASAAGKFLIVWAIIDAVLNLANLAGLLSVRRRLVDACLLAFASRLLLRHKPLRIARDFGNSLDMLVAFSIVAYIVGAGKIVELPGRSLTCWNLAVVFNVLGAGLGRLTESYRGLSV